MSPVSLLVPNYSRETFRKLLEEYPKYPQELVMGELYIVNRIRLYNVPTFLAFEAEIGFVDGVVGVLVRKIDVGTTKKSPQLEDKVSLFRGEAHLGSTRTFKVVNSENPFRIVESAIANRKSFVDYLTSICHLAAYCDKVAMRGLDAKLALVLRGAASLAAVTRYCLVEENSALAAQCKDIIVNPLFRRSCEPLESVEFRYAGQS